MSELIRTVLTIRPDGKKMRGGLELKDLSRSELLTLIDELVDLLKKYPHHYSSGGIACSTAQVKE